MDNKEFVDLTEPLKMNGQHQPQAKGKFTLFEDAEPKLYDRDQARRDAVAARTAAIASKIKFSYIRFTLLMKLVDPIFKVVIYSYVIYLMFS